MENPSTKDICTLKHVGDPSILKIVSLIRAFWKIWETMPTGRMDEVGRPSTILIPLVFWASRVLGRRALGIKV